jgi:hypothetical protein
VTGPTEPTTYGLYSMTRWPPRSRVRHGNVVQRVVRIVWNRSPTGVGASGPVLGVRRRRGKQRHRADEQYGAIDTLKSHA